MSHTPADQAAEPAAPLEVDQQSCSLASLEELIDPELGAWVYHTLRQRQPDIEISLASVKVRANFCHSFVTN